MLYGFADHELTTTFLGTSTGLRLRHDQPTGTLELNAKTADLTRSRLGRAAPPATSPTSTRRRSTRSWRSGSAGRERRVDLPAGRYETLLPPSAVADLMIYALLVGAAPGTPRRAARSSPPGGGTRIGERLADLPLTLCAATRPPPGLECAPFVIAHASGDERVGLRQRPAARPRPTGSATARSTALLQTRHSAALTGLPVTPGDRQPGADGRTAPRSLDDMVAGTERGLLLTCLWYIREVDPQTLLLTGLTRDGVYLVENGEVVGAVNNFRFNESPVDLLGRLSRGRPRPSRRCRREWGDYFTRTAMPPLRVPGLQHVHASPRRCDDAPGSAPLVDEEGHGVLQHEDDADAPRHDQRDQRLPPALAHGAGGRTRS